ncbi:flagellar filament capping protein FliD [Thermotoga sp. KOL6]|uniref:flagellar filament capping protein FliD n=1 Tax=Thermotoga sp. KOL6 TaxID=126741 RepID=UPI000C781C02|nr:flagellar filament capping protein FliD [Thermotoga sp. KOL6]PLV59857.1 flagellar hook protein FliD [Thermotoga sp. KOL6]
MDLSKIASTINMRYYSQLGGFQVGGAVSGLDTQSIINAILEAESQPLQSLTEKYEKYELMQKAYEELKTKLGEFRDLVYSFKLQSTIVQKTATSSNENLLSATPSPTAVTGIYHIRIVQAATYTTLLGSNEIVPPPDSTKTFGELDYMHIPQEGTVRIYNNETGSYNDVQILSTDTIDDIVNKLNNALSSLGIVGNASYDASTGKLSVTSDKNFSIVDISGNFTKVFHLDESVVNYDGSTYSLTSTASVSSLSTSKTLTQIASYTSKTIINGIVKINNVEISVDQNDTLSSLIEKINNSSAGVIASYDYHMNKLIITADTSGPQAITLEDTDGTGVFSLLGIETHSLYVGQKAHLQISTDGTNWVDVYSDTNDVVYNGVTFHVSGMSSETVTVDVKVDTDAIVEKIREFVDKWNEIMDYLNEKLTEEPVTDKSEEEMSEEEKMKGVLKGDDFLEGVFRRLRSFITYKVSGDINYLWELGISTGEIGTGYENMMKGRLEVDEEKLREIIEKDPEKVWEFFGGDNGFATQLDDYLWELIKFNGGIDQIAGISGRIEREQRFLATQIADWIERLSRREQELWRKFSAMEDVIAQLQSQGSWIAQALQGNNKQ